MRLFLLSLGLSAAAVAPLAAQSDLEDEVVELGMRVRVTAAPMEWVPITGQLVGLTPDSLLVLHPRRPRSVSVSTSDLSTLEISLGRARSRWSTVGAGAGAVAGIVLTRAVVETEPDDPVGVHGTPDGIAYTMSGLVAGAVVGWLLAPERWRLARLPDW
jgi:hypothetical protein